MPSSVSRSGMPRRVCSRASVWSRFRNSACCRGPSWRIVLGRVKKPPPGPNFSSRVPAANFCTASVFSGIVLPKLRLVDAGHVHLPDLLLERHAAEQVVDSLLDRLAGVAIEGSGGLLGPRDAAGQAVCHKQSQEESVDCHVLLPVAHGESPFGVEAGLPGTVAGSARPFNVPPVHQSRSCRGCWIVRSYR